MAPTNRTESFSDGVFAVAVTLLVLNLGVHGVPPGGLASALGREWPHYVTLVVSFLTIVTRGTARAQGSSSEKQAGGRLDDQFARPGVGLASRRSA
jgi:hypothetical protein